MLDLDSYHKNINDPLIGKNMWAINYPTSRIQAKKQLINIIKRNQVKPKCSDAFFIIINGECAGLIALGDIEKNHKAKIGYWLGSNYRGKGIMSVALKKLTEYGFRKYKLKRIYARVVTFNKPSVRLLEKCGYKLEGIMKKDRLKNGKYYDNYLYSIIK
jgi:[ribosomal protein S5]-alanine N-acetyltransferase